MFEKPKFFKTEKPNRSLEKNRMPSPRWAGPFFAFPRPLEFFYYFIFCCAYSLLLLLVY
jgi:hypothetical protein